MESVAVSHRAAQPADERDRFRVSDLYLEVLESPAWKMRAHVLKTWAGACEWCQSVDALDVHHLSYHNLGREEPRELVVLCRRCHANTHDAWLEPTPDALRQIADRHPESFEHILEADRFNGTWV